MAERISFPHNGMDEWGFLYEYLMEGIYLNTDGLAKWGLPRPYQYAKMELVDISPLELKPTAKYLLRSHLEILEGLAEELMAEGIDIFNMEGVVKIDENNNICPPILEVWEEPPYNGIPVIVDGAHRIYLAKKRGINIKCVRISGNISSMLPVLPLTGWEEVRECDEVPIDKRNYHPGIPSYIKPHELYRQKFHGSKGPRTSGK